MQRLILILLGLAGVLCSGMQIQSPTWGPSQYRVNEQVMNKLLIHRVDPICPIEAKNKNIPCEARVLFRVDYHGRVSMAHMIEGDPILRNVAEAAVKKWRYHPYLLAGNPIEVETMIQLHFRK